MTRKIIAGFVLLAGFGWIVASAFESYASPSLIRQSLAEGVTQYEQGRLQKAARALARVLLIDDENEKALDYLHQIRTSPQIAFKLKTQLIQLEDLVNEISRLEERLAYFNKKNAWLKKELQEQENDMTLILQEVYRLGKDLGNDVIYEKIKQKGDWKELSVLEAVIRQYQIKKNYLRNQADVAENQFVYLRSVYGDQDLVKPYPSLEPDKKQTPKKYQKTTQATPVLDNYVKGEQTLDSMILSREISLMREYIEKLETENATHEVTIDDLAAQLKEAERKNLDISVALSNKEQNLLKVNSEFADLEARLELSQKIIQKKEKELRQLRADIALIRANRGEWRADLEGKVDNKNVQLSELHGVLKIYKTKLGSSQDAIAQKDRVIEETRRDLMFVKEQLRDAQQRMQEFQKTPSQQDLNGYYLKEDLDHLKGQISDIETFISFRFGDVNLWREYLNLTNASDSRN